jgi:hypothetical protein
VSDNNLLSFEVSTRPVMYGDKRNFPEYQITMFSAGRAVGIESSPHRTFTSRWEARRAANIRIRELLKHRLFIIPVTKKCIDDGEGRNCHTCAISQALWHNQDRMGFPRRDYSFEVAPYGAFIEPRGIVLSKKYSDDSELILEPGKMPDFVTGTRNGNVFTESLTDWAMNFDDWYDSQFISLKEWREQHGYRDGERPYRPSTASFVLDLDAFEAQEAA